MGYKNQNQNQNPLKFSYLILIFCMEFFFLKKKSKRENLTNLTTPETGSEIREIKIKTS